MGQAQNRFYNEVEEWLSEATQIGGTSYDFSATAPIASAPQSADGMDNSQTMEMVQYTMSNLRQLSGQLAELSNHMKSQEGMVDQLIEAQAYLAPIVERLAERPNDEGIDNLRHEIIQLTDALREISRGNE